MPAIEPNTNARTQAEEFMTHVIQSLALCGQEMQRVSWNQVDLVKWSFEAECALGQLRTIFRRL